MIVAELLAVDERFRRAGEVAVPEPQLRDHPGGTDDVVLERLESAQDLPGRVALVEMHQDAGAHLFPDGTAESTRRPRAVAARGLLEDIEGLREPTLGQHPISDDGVRERLEVRRAGGLEHLGFEFGRRCEIVAVDRDELRRDQGWGGVAALPEGCAGREFSSLVDVTECCVEVRVHVLHEGETTEALDLLGATQGLGGESVGVVQQALRRIDVAEVQLDQAALESTAGTEFDPDRDRELGIRGVERLGLGHVVVRGLQPTDRAQGGGTPEQDGDALGVSAVVGARRIRAGQGALGGVEVADSRGSARRTGGSIARSHRARNDRVILPGLVGESGDELAEGGAFLRGNGARERSDGGEGCGTIVGGESVVHAATQILENGMRHWSPVQPRRRPRSNVGGEWCAIYLIVRRLSGSQRGRTGRFKRRVNISCEPTGCPP